MRIITPSVSEQGDGMEALDIFSTTHTSDKRLLLLAGPCQLETLDHALLVAEGIQQAAQDLPIQVVFKSSFDKANRTSGNSERGVGIEPGLAMLETVREKTGLPVITDVHEASQAAQVAKSVDMLQIPAFLCRQTDLLQACGATGKPLNIKKGQFLHPSDMLHAAKKAASAGAKQIALCERGSCFGYRDLVVDPRSFVIMRELGFPVIFDATHSVQSMGGADGASGGSREFIPALSRAAAAVGIDGLFIETHEEPSRAPSDGASMLQLDELRPLLAQLCRIRASVTEGAV